jgi:hypothetical protein
MKMKPDIIDVPEQNRSKNQTKIASKSPGELMKIDSWSI